MKRNRFIAAFLSLILIVTTMVSPVSAKENSKNPNSSSGKYSWNQLNEKSHSDKKEESSADKSGTEDEALPEDGTSAGESVIEEEAPVYLDGSLTGSDGSYNVTVTFGEDAGIPEGSAVRVEALGEDDAAYQEAKAQVQPDEEGDSFAALDISILDAEGNEIEPNAAVQVEIELSELPEGVDADTEITVSHIDESTGSAVVEDVADTAEATEGTVEVSEDTAVVNFTVESFSTFTITYTARAADSYNYPTRLKQVTLYFNTNGGTGSVSSISGESGTMVTLPTYSGTRSGYTFLGWAESRTDFPGGTGYRAVYQPGSSYELPTSNKTLYAAWQSDTASAKDAYFYIRLDGTIPYEPGSYVASDYTIGIQMKDAVTVQKWVVDVDTTKEVVGNHVSNDVTAVLSKVPSDELIAQVCDREHISYNPDTQYILWYVQKYQGLGTEVINESGEGFIANGDGWHIDGVILDRAKVALTYSANEPAGVTEIPDVPLGYSVDRGTVITVGESGAVGGSMDRANPSIPGYVFQGWNTKSDGTGTTYANGDEIKLYESMTLYAMWSKGGNALSLAKVDGLGRTINGAEFTISDGAASTPFEAGTYAANDILTDTVYTIEETEAPENYDGLDEAFRFIISSQGGTALDAYFCDADGNRVDAPEGVTLTYTNGRVNIRVTNIGYFYVYHSSAADGDIETIAMTAENLNVDGTFDIVEKTYDNYYYGGYYSKYNKVGTVYEGGSGSWTRANAYTAAGTAMQPAAGETYYLKEVPAAYLQPYLHVVYDERSLPVANELKQMYLITGVDDLNYTEIGLNAENITLGTRKTVASFKVQNSVDSVTTTITTNSIWGVKGFLGVWDQTSDLKEDYEFAYQPYFITPDGVKVEGTITRTVNTQDNHYYGTFDQGENNPGIYRIDQ